MSASPVAPRLAPTALTDSRRTGPENSSGEVTTTGEANQVVLQERIVPVTPTSVAPGINTTRTQLEQHSLPWSAQEQVGAMNATAIQPYEGRGGIVGTFQIIETPSGQCCTIPLGPSTAAHSPGSPFAAPFSPSLSPPMPVTPSHTTSTSVEASAPAHRPLPDPEFMTPMVTESDVFDRPGCTATRPNASSAIVMPSPNVSMIQAAAQGDGLTVIHLLETDSSLSEFVDHADPGGVTALHFAASYGQAKVVSHLLARGADMSIKNKHGSLPLHVAAQAGHVATARLLMSPVLARTSNMSGDTPLHTAALHGSTDVIDALVSRAEASIDVARPTTGWLPVHLAAGRGHVETVGRLLKLGAMVDARGADGDTPLMHAAAGGNLETVRFLLSSGAKVDTTSRFAATALHFAAGNGRAEIVTHLLSTGARADKKDCRGERPSDWAAREGYATVVRLLAPTIQRRMRISSPRLPRAGLEWF